MAKTLKKISRICGSCIFHDLWTGCCTKDFEWIEVGFDDKACKHWDLSPDYSFDTNDNNETQDL